jgi:Tol biopolymer transport system component
MRADGSEQTRLTDNSATDWYPEWSPDGTKIAFVSTRDGFLEIYTMNTDGSVQTHLTENYPALNVSPDWRP